MIPVDNSVLYQDALSCLKTHKQTIGQGFKGRFIQVFLGLKFFQNNLPSMFAGSFITTEVLQALLDDLYAKSLVHRTMASCRYLKVIISLEPA